MIFMGLHGIGLGDCVSNPPDPTGAADGTSCSGGQVYASFYDSCVDACPSGQSYSTSDGTCQPIVSCGGSTTNPAAKSGTPSQAGSSSWWQGALTSITQGAVGALTHGSSPTPTAVKPPSPWYLTPMGILGIVVVVGGGAYLLAKK